MKFKEFGNALWDLSACYQENYLPDDEMFRVVSSTGDMVIGTIAVRMASMIKRASRNELILRIMVYKSTIACDPQDLRELTYDDEPMVADFTFHCDARSIGRLWRTLPLWRWALPYQVVMALVGIIPDYPEGAIAVARQSWADYFAQFRQPFKGLELIGIFIGD